MDYKKAAKALRKERRLMLDLSSKMDIELLRGLRSRKQHVHVTRTDVGHYCLLVDLVGFPKDGELVVFGTPQHILQTQHR
jgi:hypothetical protein